MCDFIDYLYEPQTKNMVKRTHHTLEDSKYLKRKYAKEARDKAIRHDRWEKFTRYDAVQERFTRNENWENFLNELR